MRVARGTVAWIEFCQGVTSPLQRARRSCELAGFGAVAEIDRDLVEWNYGEYEGRPHRRDPGRSARLELFRDGCPGGESPAEAAARADRVVSRVRACGRCAAFFQRAFHSGTCDALDWA